MSKNIKNKETLKPRNAPAASLMNFHSVKFDHKAEGRGGSTNKFSGFFEEYLEDLTDIEN